MHRCRLTHISNSASVIGFGSDAPFHIQCWAGRFKLSNYLVARDAHAEPVFKDHITTAITAGHWAESAKLDKLGVERWRRHDKIIQYGIAPVRKDKWLIQVGV